MHDHQLLASPAPPPDALVGRSAELALLRELIADPEARLLTLTGPGGVGKTRLALEAAREHGAEREGDPVTVVPLAAVSDPELVLPTVARALGMREDADGPLEDRVAEVLRSGSHLLVLDNMEQILAAGATVARLAAACPALTVLMTSRSRLDVRGEHELPVSPLATPTADGPGGAITPETAAASDAVSLFVRRARAADPTFALTDGNASAVAELCRRLDGLPLAIELAAARCRVLSPAAILARLSGRLDLLTGGPSDAPDRHRSLRAAVAWSHDLLSDDDRILFRRLAVFVGPFSADAAEGVAGTPSSDSAMRSGRVSDLTAVPDGLARLLDASLVVRVPAAPESADDDVRFRLLETVRAFADAKLADSGEGDATRDRHAAWHRDRVLAAEPEMQGHRQPYWFAWLADAHDDLRAAIDWALGTGQAELALRLVTGPVWYFWSMRGWARRERHRMDRALELAERSPEAVPVMLLAKAHFDDAVFHLEAGDFPAGRARYERLLETMRAHGPAGRNGVAGILGNLALVDAQQGDYATARARLEEALAIRRDPEVRIDPGAVSRSLANLTSTAAYQGDAAAATAYGEEALAIARGLGERRTMGSVLTSLGEIAADQGHDARAVAYLDQALGQLRQVGDIHGEGLALVTLGASALRLGDPRRAAAALTEAFAQQRETQVPMVLADALEGTAELALASGRPSEAAGLLAAADVLRQTIAAVPNPFVRRRRERAVSKVRSTLDRSRIDRAEIAGRALTLDDAIATALGILDDLSTPALRALSPLPTGAAPSSSRAEMVPGLEVTTRTLSDIAAVRSSRGVARPDPDAASRPAGGPLSPRQREVLGLLVDGLSDPEIAEQLGVGARTVESHVAAILNKLGLHARTAAVAYAVRHGLA